MRALLLLPVAAMLFVFGWLMGLHARPAPVAPAPVVRYLGVSSVETMEGVVVVKFKPVKEAK
jgi:hypothetical protein